MPRLFGTDGVRGLANKELTAALALELGEAAARVLTQNNLGHRPKAIVGQDTRQSSSMLGQAVAAGLASAGVDVDHVGEIPTPGVAYLTSEQDYDLGVVISASHNPFYDNGIKFINGDGFKLPDSSEDEIEAVLGQDWERPTGEGVGFIGENAMVSDKLYMDHLIRCGRSLKGLRIALDCANGASSDVAPRVFQKLGADVVVMNAAPDGKNINDKAGSTHPEQLQALTVATGADFGFAFDGDADRCLAVDHEGKLVNGDQIMGMLAVAMKNEGRLKRNTLVVTVMSNLGLHLAMRAQGIKTVSTKVGDRYVLEEMLAHGYNIGGEQSGHVINLDHATTGDGTLTAVLVASEVAKQGKKLAELVEFVKELPQTLINVAGVDKQQVDLVAPEVAEVEAELGEKGRVLLRASGTEPLIRVMVEAATQEQADECAQRLAEVVKTKLAL
ncbi:MAG: phosphoglucosamine mutase [Actinomycetaceae bacterium]|nr:phosphoglucosamine mutase [Actinomycetaceae bacterium]MDY5854841.1 phosphoglucosamine mutase [Arcanobacterium sp.]